MEKFMKICIFSFCVFLLAFCGVNIYFSVEAGSKDWAAWSMVAVWAFIGVLENK